MRILEFAAFVALSGALHAATLVVAPLQGGPESGAGDLGPDTLTVQPATPTLAAMVENWDRVPEISQAPVLTAPTSAPTPMRPTQDTRPDIKPQHTALAAPSSAMDLPQAETRLPAPPVPLAHTAPAVLPDIIPQLGDAPALPREQSMARTTAPVQPVPDQTAPTAPDIDTAPPVSRTAPIASLRPELRPDRPAPRAAPKPKPTSSAARPKQTAKGSGANASPRAAPAAKPAAPRGPSKAQLAQLEQKWGAQITSALRRAHRPPRGAKGTVRLVIAISPAGRVTGVSVAGSSGNSRLDKAALAAVKRARFPRAPKGLTKSTYRFSQRLTVAR